ncbi:3-hydroxyacyl-[acyl-carrier-protein] dehydratase FabZ [Candidatus Rubidus massiliensis]|nr:MAG: hypothetical protein BGO10_00995 [Chlamydia sp. 32-24]CDZ81515.1 3-hydroxyacyl-[acyl-carrier-protein] dehydratase FabZ [Candidatus Rubidus massiliensis]
MKIDIPPECEEFYKLCLCEEIQMDSNNVNPMNKKQIEEVLPQRKEMLVVDSVVNMDFSKNTIHAICDLELRKNILASHFPTDPVLPGSILMEAMGQTGMILFIKKEDDLGENNLREWVQITNVFSTRFLHMIRPPGVVHVKARYFDNGFFITVIAQAIFQGKISCVCIIQAIK